MSVSIISDTSCLILLTNAGRLDLLSKLFGKVYITPIIAKEYQLPIPAWIEIRTPAEERFKIFKELLFDEGESSAFALQAEIPDAILVLDDKDARRVAIKLGLKFMGTLSIVKLAKDKGLIESGKHLLNALKKSGMRLSAQLEEDFLKTIGEI